MSPFVHAQQTSFLVDLQIQNIQVRVSATDDTWISGFFNAGLEWDV
jgi:hypothetical protein